MARKLYAYVRKDQRGTPMETFINTSKRDLENKNNSGPRVRRLSNTQVKPKSRKWDNLVKKGTGNKAISKFLDKNGGRKAAAKRALKDQHTVSFTADPKRK